MSASGNIRTTQIRSGDRHGDGAYLQASDGTGAEDNLAAFDADGNVVDSGVSVEGIGNPDTGNAPITGWTFDNQDSASSVLVNGVAGINKMDAGTNSAWTFLYRTAPTPPYKIYMRIETFFSKTFAGGGDQNGWTVGFRDSGGKYVYFQAGTSGTFYVALSKNSAANTANSDYFVNTTDGWISQYAAGYQRYLYVTIEDDNTDLVWTAGSNPNAMFEIGREPRLDYLANVANVAIGVRGSGASICVPYWNVT